MVENTLDVLVYLLKHYLQDNCELPKSTDTLFAVLMREGFDHATVQDALTWLQKLVSLSEEIRLYGSAHPHSLRVFSAYECEHMDEGARSFLLQMLERKLLTPTECELIIEQALCLDEKIQLTEGHLKIVSMIVLFHSSESHAKSALAQIEKEILLKDGGIGEH